MNNSQCSRCGNTFSEGLVNPFATSDGLQIICPICALKARNELLGLPEDKPFYGEFSRKLYETALEELKLKQNGKEKDSEQST